MDGAQTLPYLGAPTLTVPFGMVIKVVEERVCRGSATPPISNGQGTSTVYFWDPTILRV